MKKLTLAGVAMTALLMVGSVGTCYGDVAVYYDGSYSEPYYGPYYGPYGPYDSGAVIITGRSRRSYYGTHHFFGIGFGNRGSSHWSRGGHRGHR